MRGKLTEEQKELVIIYSRSLHEFTKELALEMLKHKICPQEVFQIQLNALTLVLTDMIAFDKPNKKEILNEVMECISRIMDKNSSSKVN